MQPSKGHKCYQITRGLYHAGFRGNRRKSNKEALTGVQKDEELLFRRSLPAWQVSSEPANSRPLRICSGDVPERIWHKPRKEWGRLSEWSSSWSKGLSEPEYAKFWPRWWLRQLGNKHDLLRAHGCTHEVYSVIYGPSTYIAWLCNVLIIYAFYKKK